MTMCLSSYHWVAAPRHPPRRETHQQNRFLLLVLVVGAALETKSNAQDKDTEPAPESSRVSAETRTIHGSALRTECDESLKHLEQQKHPTAANNGNENNQQCFNTVTSASRPGS
jgi:hypothetical protein